MEQGEQGTKPSHTSFGESQAKHQALGDKYVD